ncbi:MAG: ABC transporter ATP-binding protein [Gammaproteobacteria bacterium]|nr:ABC transporter ATP-binding protein [Gammaproteobacteria bacterium]
MTALVEIENLTKIYRGAERPALNGLSLAIRAGSFFGLLGPNGAGKSTTLSILSGLLPVTGGEVRVGGLRVSESPDRVKSLLGLVPQDLALYPTLTPRENLRFFGRMQGLNGARLEERVSACLAMARLEDLADRRAETFSGGLKRRLNLVIGLIHEPKLLILDEPTVGIDPQSRNFIHESLRTLHRQGMTILYSTHYMEEAEQLCDDIAIIDHGRILAQGTLTELLRAHRHGAIEARLDSVLTETAAAELRSLPQARVSRIESRSFAIETDAPETVLAAALATLQRHKLTLASLSLGAMNLEQVFLALTGTRLRD